MRAWIADTDGHLAPAITECLTAAIAAPSIHNTQPWRFRVHANVIDLYADRSRQLNVVDPSGRELMISLGAALLNLRVAMLARGRLPIHRLLPDRAQYAIHIADLAAGDPAAEGTFRRQRPGPGRAGDHPFRVRTARARVTTPPLADVMFDA